MNVYEKLNEARKLVRGGKYKKDGRNDYSKYDYFTPEMVEFIVSDVCEKQKLLTVCNLRADEHGLFQELKLVNMENVEDCLTFELRTVRGDMKATNETQQMGGTDTYSERYIKMKVFQIKDNNLDFDSQDNRPEAKTAKPASAPKVSPDIAFKKAAEAIKKCQNLAELETVEEQINKSPYIPDRRSAEGKRMRDELSFMASERGEALKANEVPFE